MNTDTYKTSETKSTVPANNASDHQSAGKSGVLLKDNRTSAVAQRKLKEGMVQKKASNQPVIQRIGDEYSMGADSGADNAGEFYLEDQRRQARARREQERQQEIARQAEARRRQEAVDAARRLITGNIQLSANKPAVLHEFDRLLQLPGQGSPEEIAYRAMNNVMNAINGSDNAEREQHGGERGFSRR